MFKISMTGGTGLIGAEIARSLSLENNVNLIKARFPDVNSMVDQARDSDIFINNAMHTWGQVDLLMRLYNAWKKEEKLIINIGSRAASPNVSKGYEYSTVKAAINHFSDLVRFKDREKLCRVTTINPGLVGKIDGVSLAPSYIAEVVAWLINQPRHVEISVINLSHVAPYELVQKMKVSGKK